MSDVWVVESSRQGVRRPIKVDSSEYPKELNLCEYKSYGVVSKHQNEDGTGAWLSTLFYSLNEEDAEGYYGREFNRFEHIYGPHRFFKYKATGAIFIESDYDGVMHYAYIVGEVHMTRLWAKECVEVLDYEGTPIPTKLTGHYNRCTIVCPMCEHNNAQDDTMNVPNYVYEMKCSICKKNFEVMLHQKITYSTSTNIKKFMEEK